MIDIKTSFNELRRSVPSQVKIVAVTKTRQADDIITLYDCGHRLMGENRVQELVSKRDQLPGDIEWHLIGHLQSNKIKYISGFIDMIHSVDSIKLLRAISNEGVKAGRVIDVLLQVHIATEETKFGFSKEEVSIVGAEGPGDDMPGVRVRGLMGMASFSDDMHLVRSEFRSLRVIFEALRAGYYSNDTFDTLSMGMSSDYRVAIEEGSNMIRVGTSIFGERLIK